MSNIEQIKDFLKTYDGPDIRIMEVCGSHTAAIAKNGIPGMLSEKIHLLSGPGCPVCVTPSSYIDRLIELALQEHTCVVTFGDLIRVPGSSRSLGMAKGEGARVEMVYSPMDMIPLAQKERDTTFVFAAVGFETTTPVYALLLEQMEKENITNIKLLTALKTMPEAVEYLCANKAPIQGFIAPGHVCVITGSNVFAPIAEKYQIPFGVSGFSGEELLWAIYGIVKAHQQGIVMNFYPSVVSEVGNTKAQELVNHYFEKTDATWRGMGIIPKSGMCLKEEYAKWDAGSRPLVADQKMNPACRCDQVLMGKASPKDCPLFGKVCSPLNPQGACMVSTEGSCHSQFVYQSME